MLDVSEPIIESVFPSYGPQAGGTNITVTGELLKNDPEEQLTILLKSKLGGIQPCQPIYKYWLVKKLSLKIMNR